MSTPSPLAALIKATGAPSSADKRGRIDVSAAAAQIVRHVEDDQSRQTEPQDRRGEHEMALQVGAIEDQQDGVRPVNATHLAFQYIVRNLFVFGTWD